MNKEEAPILIDRCFYCILLRHFTCYNWRKIGVFGVSFEDQKASKPLQFQHFLCKRLHRGEEQDVADAVGIGEQHYEAVEAEAQAARGRKAVFEGA